MTLLDFDWSISLESFARAAFWFTTAGFFLALGWALFGFIPRGSSK